MIQITAVKEILKGLFRLQYVVHAVAWLFGYPHLAWEGMVLNPSGTTNQAQIKKAGKIQSLFPNSDDLHFMY